MDQETWDNLDVLQRYNYLVWFRRQNKHREVNVLNEIKVQQPKGDSYQEQQRRKPKWAR
jgi:hypothetical protein